MKFAQKIVLAPEIPGHVYIHIAYYLYTQDLQVVKLYLLGSTSFLGTSYVC